MVGGYHDATGRGQEFISEFHRVQGVPSDFDLLNVGVSIAQIGSFFAKELSFDDYAKL